MIASRTIWLFGLARRADASARRLTVVSSKLKVALKQELVDTAIPAYYRTAYVRLSLQPGLRVK